MQGISPLLSVPSNPSFHAERKGHFQGQNRPKLASLYQRIGPPYWDPEFDHLCVLLSRNDLDVHRMIRVAETIFQLERIIAE